MDHAESQHLAFDPIGRHDPEGITGRKRAEEALAKSERHFRALIENSADCVALVDANGAVRYASPSTKRVFGFDPEEVVGTDAFLWVHPDDQEELKQTVEELKALPGASVVSQYRALRKDGGWQWMESTASNQLHDPAVAALIINQRDISERKAAEAALLRFEAIVESANEAIIGSDRDGTIVSWNPAARRIFGYSAEEALGRNIAMLVPPEREAEYEELISIRAHGKSVANFETVRVARDGRRIDVSLNGSPIRDRDRRITGYCVILHDITERHRMEREILRIADYEKQRLGHDLHDDLCQILAGISLLGNALYEELQGLAVPQAADALQVKEMALSAVARARNLAKGLSPLRLAGTGLIPALQALAAETERLYRIPCGFECDAPFEIESETEANHLYRIAQEALHNAIKHSQATQLRLCAQAKDGILVVAVRDNGIGMPEGRRPAPAPTDGRSGGLGMHTMSYRARIVGATLEFQRNPEGGTSVVCTLPLAAGRALVRTG